MSDLDHAHSLMRMAHADLNALKGMLSLALSLPKTYFSDEIFGFHAQQTAEKCLKAWIATLGRRYPRTHDLMSLVEDLLEAGEDVTTLDRLVDLNPFAVEYRYEALDSDEEPIDRNAFFQEVQDLFDIVAKKIGF
jgi:HEPN domain-containing protein